MRIAFIRGPNLNAWELQNLDGLPHELVAFASRSGKFEFEGVDVPVERLPCPLDPLAKAPPLVRAGLIHFAGQLDYLVGLERHLRGFDVAHAADLLFPYSLQALKAKEQGAVKRVVLTVWENIAYPVYENALVAKRAQRIAAGVDHCVAISEDAALHLTIAGVPEDRITVLPMGIDLERFSPGDRGDGERPLEILCVSRLVHEKGVEDVVIAAGLLRERGVRVRVKLVGQGPLEGRLREVARKLGVEEDVELAGTIPYAELPAAYRAADVFVMASGPRTTWREQFGFAIVEAMATGLPVIAGDSGSLPEVVADADSLVVPHDPRRLAERLAALASDPAERRRQGERNRRWAERRYDRHKVCAGLSEVYESVVARPARSSSST